MLSESVDAALKVERRLGELLAAPAPAPLKEVLEAFGPVSKLQTRMAELHGLEAATSLVQESAQTQVERSLNAELERSMGEVKGRLGACFARLKKD